MTWLRLSVVFLLFAVTACATRPDPPKRTERARVNVTSVAEYRVTVSGGQISVTPIGDARIAQRIQGDPIYDATVQDATDGATPASVGSTFLLHPDAAPAYDTACNASPFADTGVPGGFQGVCQSWSLWNPFYGAEAIRTYVEVVSITNTNDSGAITTYNTVAADNEMGIGAGHGIYSYATLRENGALTDHWSVNWYFATPEPGASAHFTYTVRVYATPVTSIVAVGQGDPGGGMTYPFCPPDPTEPISMSGSGAGPNPEAIWIVYVSTDSRCGGASSSHPQVVRVRSDDTTGATAQIISHAYGSSGSASNGANTHPVINDSGEYVAWQSTSTNLISGVDDLGLADGNGATQDVFVRYVPLPGSVGTEVTAIVSADIFSGTTIMGAAASAPAIDSTGGYVAFVTSGELVCYDPSLGFGSCDYNALDDVYVREVWSGGLLALVSPDTGSRTAGASAPTLSDYGIAPNGGFIVGFVSSDASFVMGDSNGVADVFVTDVINGGTTRQSVRSGGGQATCASDQPQVDASGSYVVFRSCDTGMVGSSTTSGRYHVYHKTIGTAGSLWRADGYVPGGGEANDSAGDPRTEHGGRLVAFRSAATNLVNYPISYVAGLGPQLFLVDARATDPARQRTWILSSSRTQFDSLTAVGPYALASSGSYVTFLDSTSSGLPTLPMGWATGSSVIELAPSR